MAQLEKDVDHFICRKLENLGGFGHRVVIPCRWEMAREMAFAAMMMRNPVLTSAAAAAV